VANSCTIKGALIAYRRPDGMCCHGAALKYLLELSHNHTSNSGSAVLPLFNTGPAIAYSQDLRGRADMVSWQRPVCVAGDRYFQGGTPRPLSNGGKCSYRGSYIS
jgi:hypothetical protein